MASKKKVAVGTTAVQIAPALKRAQVLYVANHGANSAFVGPTGVTSANGLEVRPRETLELKSQRGAVFAICAAASSANLQVALS